MLKSSPSRSSSSSCSGSPSREEGMLQSSPARSSSSCRSGSPGSDSSTDCSSGSSLPSASLGLFGKLPPLIIPLDMLRPVQKTQTACQEVITGLYLGNRTAPMYIPDYDIHCVIDISGLEREPGYQPAPLVKIISDVWDDGRLSISRYFDEISEMIHQELEAERKVLVHCYAGQNRSPALVLAYLMKHRGMSLDEGMDLLVTKRPEVEIKAHFVAELEEWEQELLARRGPSLS